MKKHETAPASTDPSLARNLHRRTLSVSEAAQILGIGRSAAYDAARIGQLPTIRIGKRILVPIAALERFLTSPERSNDHPSES